MNEVLPKAKFAPRKLQHGEYYEKGNKSSSYTAEILYIHDEKEREFKIGKEFS